MAHANDDLIDWRLDNCLVVMHTAHDAEQSRELWASYEDRDLQVTCGYMIDSNKLQHMTIEDVNATEGVKAETQTYQLSNDKQ